MPAVMRLKFAVIFLVSLVLAVTLKTTSARADLNDSNGTSMTSAATITSMPAATSAQAKPAATTSNSKLTLGTGLLSNSVEDKIVNSKTTGALIVLSGERNFNSYISGVLEMYMSMMTGNVSNRYSSEGAPGNGFGIGQANITAKVWSHGTETVAITGGVLPVDFTTLISMMDGVGFPGFKESLESKGESMKGQVWASQTSPTSSTPAVKSSESGINSSLQMVGANFSTDPKETDDYVLKAGATQFDFQNLTSSAATDSQYGGNSVTQIGNQAKFKYEFKGVEGAASVSAKVGHHWQFEVLGSSLTNYKAPTNLNKASMGQMRTTYLMDNTKITGTVASFYNEADTLPAAYSLGGIGNNNRFGWTASLKSEWEKEKVMGVIKFVQANEIQDNIYTADRQIINLMVEAKYDIL